MTPVAGSEAFLDGPDEWFERSQQAFAEIRARLERRKHELDAREQELEARAKELVARGEQLQAALGAAEKEARDLSGRSQRLREEERALAANKAELARKANDVEARESAVAAREARVAETEVALRARGESLARSQIDADRAQEHLAALDSLRAALADRLRDIDEGLEAVPAHGCEKEASPEGTLALMAELQVALDVARSRQGVAEQRLEEASKRAAEIDRFAQTIRDQEGRLAQAREEIANARDALVAVDGAVARLPYEVVDDFTRSAEFEAYDRALRALKRFAEARP